MVIGEASISFASPLPMHINCASFLALKHLTPNLIVTIQLSHLSILLQKNFFLIGRIFNESDSLFTYNPGQSPATFMNMAFLPVFDPIKLPFYNIPGAAKACGESLECLFDIGSTGLISVGTITLEAQMEFNETLDLSEPGMSIIAIP